VFFLEICLFFTILLPKIRIPGFQALQSFHHEERTSRMNYLCKRLCFVRLRFNTAPLAVYFISLQFIVIINSNSKHTWEQYYRQLCSDSPNTIQVSGADIGTITATQP
jgi:hypothetical protein